jgi:hypothetical protein
MVPGYFGKEEMMNKKTILNITAGLVMVLSLALAMPAVAGKSTAGTKIGIMTCQTVPHSGFSLLVHSTVDIKCRFESTDGSGVERYIGETGVALGVDLSSNVKKELVYAVFATDFKSGSYKLAGKYGGVGASASVGAGAGAQVLLGSNNNSISLQPVIEGNTGIGVSAGITYLYLEPER